MHLLQSFVFLLLSKKVVLCLYFKAEAIISRLNSTAELKTNEEPLLLITADTVCSIYSYYQLI